MHEARGLAAEQAHVATSQPSAGWLGPGTLTGTLSSSAGPGSSLSLPKPCPCQPRRLARPPTLTDGWRLPRAAAWASVSLCPQWSTQQLLPILCTRSPSLLVSIVCLGRRPLTFLLG